MLTAFINERGRTFDYGGFDAEHDKALDVVIIN